jgi:hypothetical protein
MRLDVNFPALAIAECVTDLVDEHGRARLRLYY